MKKIVLAFVAIQLLSSSSALAFGVQCSSEGAGVGGVMTDQQDIIEAINCLGQQIAAVNNRSASRQAVQTEERQILELQKAVNELSRQISELKATQANR
jgi:TolA-binding protein